MGFVEPLYLTTLRQLGQDISKLPHLDKVEKLPLGGCISGYPNLHFEKEQRQR